MRGREKAGGRREMPDGGTKTQHEWPSAVGTEYRRMNVREKRNKTTRWKRRV